jgi:hypothetical protein
MTEPGTTEIGKPEDFQGAAELAAQFPNRLAVTGVILDCLRQLFAVSANVMHPQLEGYFWAPDTTSDPLKAPYQIIIEDGFKFDLSKDGIRPAILVEAGAWQESRLAIGDGGIAGEAYHKKVRGSHTVKIVGKTVPQAELLAREVQGYLSHFGPILREWLSFSRWEVPVLSAPEEVEEQSENVIISVTVAYELVYAWELKPAVSRLLRQIVVSAIMKDTGTEIIKLGA